MLATTVRGKSAENEARHFMFRLTYTRFMVLAVVVLALSIPELGHSAEDDFDMDTKWLKPGKLVTIALNKSLSTVPPKVFLRLKGERGGRDLPLDREQLIKRLAQTTIPQDMKSGMYKATLVNETGETLAVGPTDRKVPSCQKPVITRIVPDASFPDRHGRYHFEVCGEHFDPTTKDNLNVKIDGFPVKFAKAVKDDTGKAFIEACDNTFPCLIRHWRSLRVYGLSLEGQMRRPLQIAVEVDRESSEEKTLLLSPVSCWVPAVVSIVLPLFLIGIVLFWSRKKAARQVAGESPFKTLAYLLTEPQTNTYSLARLQLLLWTVASVLAYVYLASSQFLIQWRWQLPAVPDGLPMLLGLSAGTTVLSVFTTEAKGSKGAGGEHPAISDFFTTGCVFAPERLQFFLWTVLGVIGFTGAILAQDPASVQELPKVPDSFLPLMGASSLGYLAGKLTRKPGPIIKQLDPQPPDSPSPTGLPHDIRVIGENLSPRAQVRLYGVLLSSTSVKRVPGQPEDAEFVRELILTAPSSSDRIQGAASVSIVNPDGQTAEK